MAFDSGVAPSRLLTIWGGMIGLASFANVVGCWRYWGDSIQSGKLGLGTAMDDGIRSTLVM